LIINYIINDFKFTEIYMLTKNFSTSDFDVFEGMTSISAVIRSIVDSTSDRTIVEILYDQNKARQKSRELKYLSRISSELGFCLSPVDASEIDAVCSGNTHGGLVAICTKRHFSVLNVNFLTSGSFFSLIDGVEDPYNFGYSVRSLYAAGVDGIVLPERNWMELSGTVSRSSAGTSELANICFSDPLAAAKLFKDNGFEVVCAGIRDSVPCYEHDFSKPLLLIVGGEKRGISSKLSELADATVRIEYGREFLGSLPTASAVSVIAFEIARQKARKQSHC
jgi:23S rRNA (guanosine2251-2'-O)-methyltransferase